MDGTDKSSPQRTYAVGFPFGGSDLGAGLFASGAGGVWVRERQHQIAGHA